MSDVDTVGAAEAAVLGGMMLSADAVAEVLPLLGPDDFYRPAHGTIYTAITGLYERGAPTDQIAVMRSLTESKDLTRVGGAVYLHDLVAAVPTSANAGYFAVEVAKAATLRRLERVGYRIVQMATNTDPDIDITDVAAILDRANTELEAVNHAVGNTGPQSMADLVGLTMEELERIADPNEDNPGVPIGLVDLAHIIPSLALGSVTIIAGRPATGKSTLAANLAQYAAVEHGIPSLIFSLEMSRSEIMQRIMSAVAKVNFTAMRAGTMTDEEWARLAKRSGDVMDSPLHIDDTPGQTPSQILAIARRFQQRHGLKLLVVDYAQLVTTGKKAESRQVEVSEISRMMKLIAKALNVAVVLVAQVNRGPEQRQDKKPMLSDLRESGSLEQDCDNALLVHRPSLYDENDRPGEADLIVAKHRNGATGTAAVAFQGHYCRFVGMA